MVTPSLRSSSVVLFAAPVVALSACTPNEPASNVPGTTPPIWTGSPAPAGMDAGHGGSHGDGMSDGMAHGGGMPAAAPAEDTLTAVINGADGSQIAAATIAFQDGFATVTVQTTQAGRLAPGSHGMHIHNVGKCEPNSVAPAAAPPATSFPPAGISRAAAGTATPLTPAI